MPPFRFVLEVRQTRIFALEMVVHHWSANLSLEDGMLLDLCPGVLVAELMDYQLSTPISLITWTSFIHSIYAMMTHGEQNVQKKSETLANRRNNYRIGSI